MKVRKILTISVIVLIIIASMCIIIMIYRMKLKANKPIEAYATATPDAQYSREELVKLSSEFKDNIVDITDERYSYEDVKADIEQLKKEFPDRITVNIAGVTHNGRNIYEVIFGKTDAAKHFMIQGSIHAREYITSLLLMRQLEYYVKRYDTVSYENIKLSELFKDVAFHIVPMANPDGVAFSQEGLNGINDSYEREMVNRLYKEDLANQKVYDINIDQYLAIWKANALGVDINRNFNNQWELYEGADGPARLNYKGSRPEAEAESKALADIVNKQKMEVALAYHASGNLIYWDYKQNGQIRQDCAQLVTYIRDITGYKPVFAKDKELSVAGFSDWLVLVKGIPAATVEIGSVTAPVPIEQFTDIWRCNRDVWAEIAFRYGEK